jgi:hypothetical protein
MTKSHRNAGRAVAVLAAIPLAILQAHAAEATASWIGQANGAYTTASNWDIGQVPLNNAGTTYIVSIGSGKVVSYNTPNPQTIDQFLLDVGSQFNLSSSSLISPSKLTVLGQALIAGSINANNATFIAQGTGTSFLGNTTTVSASNGGVVRIAAPAFDASGLGNSTIISAAGAGSLVDLSSVLSLNVGQGSAYNSAISATTGGKINLSGVTSLLAPASNVSLIFNENGGADINLASLQTLGGVTADSGTTSFTLDASTAEIGPLQKANRLVVSLQNASTMALGGYAGAANVSNSTFAVTGGSKLNAGSLVGTLSERGLTNSTLLSAAGSGSVLDLSGLQTLDVGQSGAYNDFITASGGAKIKLSGVTNLIAPASATALIFSANGGADIDLSSLQMLGGVTTDSGTTSFVLDGSTAELGPLQKANRLNVSLQNASTMTLGGYAGAANVTNSTFAVAGGSKLNAASLVGTLSERGLGNGTLLSATGNGSLLDLSGIQTLDAGESSAYNEAINASSGARINLKGVTNLIAPASTVQLIFTATSGADINLSSLQTLGGVTTDSGTTTFNLDAATAVIGPLQKGNRLVVNLQNASTMTLGGFSGAADITNSTFTVAGGSKLNASSLVGTLSERGLGNNTLLSAAGSGSVLDLSGLRSFDAGEASAYNEYVTATSGAKINLSGVTSVTAPATTVSLVFTANSGADINLSALQTLGGVTADSGTTTFNLDGATAELGPLQKANRLIVNLQNASTMTLGGYAGAASVSNSIFSVAGGSRLNASSLLGTLSEPGLGNNTLLSAAGNGSLLDLSGLQTLDAGQSSAYNEYVTATSGAKINLAGVKTLIAPISGVAVTFTANSGANIDLGGLQTISNASGQVNFNVASAGSLLLHGLNANPGVHFNLSDAGSQITVKGSLALLNGSTMAAGAGTTVAVSGNFSFQQTVESQMNLDAATLALDGSGGQALEIGGKHIGLPTAGSLVGSNFAIGVLDVGLSGAATVVSLQDAIDNGNRSGGSEALYLNGSAGGNGLHILGGSILALDNLDLYTVQNGLWVHINDLFTNGVTKIAYDQGFIELGAATTLPVPEPGTWALLTLGLAAIGWRRRESMRAGA